MDKKPISYPRDNFKYDQNSVDRELVSKNKSFRFGKLFEEKVLAPNTPSVKHYLDNYTEEEITRKVEALAADFNSMKSALVAIWQKQSNERRIADKTKYVNSHSQQRAKRNSKFEKSSRTPQEKTQIRQFGCTQEQMLAELRQFVDKHSAK